MSTTILGGGLGGLSAAYYLLKKDPKSVITLVEASNRVGGWIKSNTQDDGVIFEQGPRTVRPKGPQGANTLALIEELDLSSHIKAIPTYHPAATKRMIYANSKLHLLPASFTSLFKKQTPFSKPLISLLFKDVITGKPAVAIKDESIYDFVTRRFGTEVGDYLIAPMICGICGGDAKQISVKFLMEGLFEKEQKHGSITRGIIASWLNKEEKKNENKPKNDLYQRSINERWNVYTFDNGIESLPKRLEEVCRANGTRFEMDAKCTGLDFSAKITTELSNGRVLTSDKLISSISAENLSALLINKHPDLAKLLQRIKTVTLAVVNLQFNEKLPIEDGFGFLVCPKENRPILGVIYDSCCFSYTDKTVLTVMLGGHWFYDHFNDNTSEEEFLHVALTQVADILKIDQLPDNYKVNLLKNAIPQYTVGHKENLELIQRYIDAKRLKLHLCGSSYHGVGINDVIMSARNMADEI